MSQLTDAWYAMLESQGYVVPFHREDAWRDLLFSLGYSGALADMEYQFWCDGGVIGPPIVPPNVLTTDSGDPLTDDSGLNYITEG